MEWFVVYTGAAVSRALSDAEGQLSQANLMRQRQIEDAQGLWARQMAEVEAAWEKRVAGEMMINIGGFQR